jgi:protein farnesyltransferase subunit beta
MTIISLLDLPLTLPPDSQARLAGLETLTHGLPQYLSRCKSRWINLVDKVLTSL